jgi:tripartite-type tricarboxylate transporter receptor subunit TctC
LIALGVTSRQRSPSRDVPTIEETGLAGYDATSWFGLMAPRASRRRSSPGSTRLRTRY